jgi:DNA-binding transcriptional LysR family regulator
VDLVTQMRVFVRVAEAQGFTAAARQLSVSKSVVSKYIGELEDRLGVRLFHRTTRHLSLTEHGAGYYERCTHILAEIEEAEATIGAADTEPRGTVRLVLPTNFALSRLMPALPALMKACPLLDVDLVLDDYPHHASEGAADIAVRLLDSEGSAGEDMRVLSGVAMSLAAAPSYLQNTPAPMTPQDLAFHNCLTLARPLGETTWRLQGAAIRVGGTLQANSFEALLGGARAGLGIALLPHALAAEDFADGRLVRVLESSAPLPWCLAAVCNAGDSPPARVRAILELLVELARDPSDAGRVPKRTAA